MKLNIIIEKYTTIIIVKGTTAKVLAEIFGSLEKSSYLCSVRMKVLAIRAESREGKTISTLPI